MTYNSKNEGRSFRPANADKDGRRSNRKSDTSGGDGSFFGNPTKNGSAKRESVINSSSRKVTHSYANESERTGSYQKRRERTYSGEEKRRLSAKPQLELTEKPVNGADETPFLLIGRNAVREALRANRSIDRILVSTETDGSLREIINLARDQKLIIREVDRKKLDELCMPFGHGGKTANHQGIVAYAAGVEYCSVADILAMAEEKNEEPFVIVLDGIEDPHNLGSIIRSADCAGVHGIVIGKRRSASVTAAVVKASAGASEFVKIARVVNIPSAIVELKKAGVWVAGADMQGQPMSKQSLSGALALVIGNEGEGLSKLVREKCDFLVSIPMRGHIDSLNAGVAAAVLMFEKRRQDGK